MGHLGHPREPWGTRADRETLKKVQRQALIMVSGFQSKDHHRNMLKGLEDDKPGGENTSVRQAARANFRFFTKHENLEKA
jgi:hypothetical protein